MERPLTQRIRPDTAPPNLSQYEATGGYEAARKALLTIRPPQEVQKLVSDSTLRGRGGAGFATGMKWSFVPMGPDAPRPKYLVANADEMEPGTFKDRLLLEGDPHQMVESIIVSAYAIQADVGYIFLRWCLQAGLLSGYSKPLSRLGAKWLFGRGPHFGSTFSFELHLHTSAGRYICGEESGAPQCPGRQARHSTFQASLSTNVRPLGKTDRRPKRGDVVQRAAHRSAWR